MVSRTVPFMQVLKTTYVRGRGPQRIRKVILITFNDAIATPDAYVSGVGFVKGNEAGTPLSWPVLSEVIPEPIRNATIRVLSPSLVAPGSFGAGLLAGFNAASKLKVDLFFFDPASTLLLMKAYGALVATLGPIQEIAGPSTTTVSGTITFEVEYTSNSGAEA